MSAVIGYMHLSAIVLRQRGFLRVTRDGRAPEHGLKLEVCKRRPDGEVVIHACAWTDEAGTLDDAARACGEQLR